MLKIYDVILGVVGDLKPVMKSIERQDPDLARQMRRAASSVALNTAEGMYSGGRNKGARYQNALGSMRETLACIEVASALGYVDGSTHRSKIGFAGSSARSCGSSGDEERRGAGT